MIMDYGMIIHVVTIAVSSLLIAGGAIAACAVLGKTSASLRHLVLVGMFVSLLALPAMSLLLPTWSVLGLPGIELLRREAPVETGFTQAERAEIPPTAGINTSKAPGDATVANPDRPLEAAPIERSERPNAASLVWTFVKRRMPLLALAVWGVGALIVLIVQLVRWAGAGFIAEMATTVDDRALLSTAERIRWEMGIKRRVGLLRSEMAAVSMAWGIRQPYVILPAGSDEWPADKAEAVLRHELAHVKRADNLMQIIAVVVCGLYWFNPLVWIAMRRLHFEREVACDNVVLNAGSAASAYAKHLMDISLSLSGPKSKRIIPAVMAHSSNVKQRLVSVLNPEVSRRPAGMKAAAACVGLVILFSLPVSALRLDDGSGDPVRRAAFESLEISESRDAGSAEGESMSISGDIHITPARKYKYLRSGKMSMSGSYTSTGDYVFISEADIEDRKSKIRIEAKNVELDPDAELGCSFKGRGYLYITRREGRREIEYRVRQRRKSGDYLIESSLEIDGKNGEFSEARIEEFRDIAVELYNVFVVDGDDTGEVMKVHVEDETESSREYLVDDGQIQISSVMIDGNVHSNGPYGTLSIEGTVSISDGEVRIIDATILSENGDLEFKGKNVLLDPEDPDGFRFDGRGGRLQVWIDENGRKLEWRITSRKRRNVTTRKGYFYEDGNRHESSDAEKEMLRKICIELHEYLMPITDDSRRLDTDPGFGNSWKRDIDYSGRWAFSGSLDDDGRFVEIVDGALVNRNGKVALRGANVILDDGEELGCRFVEDEDGYLIVTAHTGEGELEYRYECERNGRRATMVRECFINGIKASFDERRNREFKLIVDEANMWFHGNVEALEPAPPAPPKLRAIPNIRVPAPPAKRAFGEARAAYEITTSATSPTRARASAHARAEARALSTERAYAEYAADLFDLVEEIAEDFEEIEENFEDRIDSRRASEALVDAYEKRQSGIERIMELTRHRFQRERDARIMIEGCLAILGEFENVAIDALEICERDDSREELQDVLDGFYVELIDVIREKIVELEDGDLSEPGSRLFDAQNDLLHNIHRELEETHEKIEKYD